MKASERPADQQFFADLFSGLVLNLQRLGLPNGSLYLDLPRHKPAGER